MHPGIKEHFIVVNIMALIGFFSYAWPLAACNRYLLLGSCCSQHDMECILLLAVL